MRWNLLTLVDRRNWVSGGMSPLQISEGISGVGGTSGLLMEPTSEGSLCSNRYNKIYKDTFVILKVGVKCPLLLFILPNLQGCTLYKIAFSVIFCRACWECGSFCMLYAVHEHLGAGSVSPIIECHCDLCVVTLPQYITRKGEKLGNYRRAKV